MQLDAVWAHLVNPDMSHLARKGDDFCGRQSDQEDPSNGIRFAAAQSNQYEIRAGSAQTLLEPGTANDLRDDLDLQVAGENLAQDIGEQRRYRHDRNSAYRQA
jgi:hypothetical protein